MIEKFFTPVSLPANADIKLFSGNIVQHRERFPLPGHDIKIAIMGVYDERLGGAQQPNAATAYATVRQELYNLYYKFPAVKIADLGNLIPGASADDTLSAVGMVVNELAAQDIITIILGNKNILGLGQYAGFDTLNKYTELTYFDNKFSVNTDELIYRVVGHEPNHLFNLNQMGYQTYLTDDEAITALEKMYFDSVRLGALRGTAEVTEPSLRNSQICVFDMACTKYGDAPGSPFSSPNGISAREACQIARYAGVSPKLYTYGIYGHSDVNDTNNTTAKLMAQMIWYFTEGVASRKTEDPVKEQDKFLQYRTALNNGQHEIVFYKSRGTGRWWMEIPHPKNHSENTFPIVVPCSYSDYQTACNNEMPDRWWRVFQKFT